MGRARGTAAAVATPRGRFDAVFGEGRSTRLNDHIRAMSAALDAGQTKGALTHYLLAAQEDTEDLRTGTLVASTEVGRLLDAVYDDLLAPSGGRQGLAALLKDLGGQDWSPATADAEAARALRAAKLWSQGELSLPYVIEGETATSMRRHLRGASGLLAGLGAVLGDMYAGPDGVDRLARATGSHWAAIEGIADQEMLDAAEQLSHFDAADWANQLRIMQETTGTISDLPVGAELLPAGGKLRSSVFQAAVADAAMAMLQWRWQQ